MTGLSVSLTSVWESELVLWHKNSMYTSALLYMDSDRSEKLKRVDTERLLIKSSVWKTRINPAGWKSPLWGSQEANPISLQVMETVCGASCDDWRMNTECTAWPLLNSAHPGSAFPKPLSGLLYVMPPVQPQLSLWSCTASSSIIRCWQSLVHDSGSQEGTVSHYKNGD